MIPTTAQCGRRMFKTKKLCSKSRQLPRR